MIHFKREQWEADKKLVKDFLSDCVSRMLWVIIGVLLRLLKALECKDKEIGCCCEECVFVRKKENEMKKELKTLMDEFTITEKKEL